MGQSSGDSGYCRGGEGKSVTRYASSFVLSTPLKYLCHKMCLRPKKPKSISDNGGDKKDGNNEGENADDDHNRKGEWGQA